MKNKKKEGQSLPQNKTDEDQYLFLGMPNSGKTVLFVSMVHALQSYLNKHECKYIDFISANTRSSKFVAENVRILENRGWPDKTNINESYEYDFNKTYWGVWENKRRLIYRDYPGEVIHAAFCLSEEDLGIYKKGVTEFQNAIRHAKGVFLIVDSSILYQKNTDPDISIIAAGICQKLKESRAKVAVVFTKMDLFSSIGFDPQERFRSEFEDASSHLRSLGEKVRYFEMDVVNSQSLVNGKKIPSEDYRVSNNALKIIKPALWMWGIEEIENYTTPQKPLQQTILDWCSSITSKIKS